MEAVWAENAAIIFCKSKGGDKWKELSNWLKIQGDPKTKSWRSICFKVGNYIIKGWDPSEKMCASAKKAWEYAEEQELDSSELLNLDSESRKKTIKILI